MLFHACFRKNALFCNRAHKWHPVQSDWSLMTINVPFWRALLRIDLRLFETAGNSFFPPLVCLAWLRSTIVFLTGVYKVSPLSIGQEIPGKSSSSEVPPLWRVNRAADPWKRVLFYTGQKILLEFYYLLIVEPAWPSTKRYLLMICFPFEIFLLVLITLCNCLLLIALHH